MKIIRFSFVGEKTEKKIKTDENHKKRVFKKPIKSIIMHV